MAPERPQRRFRFSLRTLFMVVGVVSVMIAIATVYVQYLACSFFRWRR